MIARALAAFAFAGLLLVAVGTVSLRIASLRARARLERLAVLAEARTYEVEHRTRALAAATTPAVLAELLRGALERRGVE